MNNKKIIVEMDGNAWCAKREDFVDQMQSIAGFGSDPALAVSDLLKNEIAGQWVSTPESSNVARYKYDEKNLTLDVNYRNTESYRYTGVSIQTYDHFLSFESVGKALSAIIKPSHACEKLEQ